MTSSTPFETRVPAAVRFAANHVATSWSRKVATEDFLAALRDEETPDEARYAVATFLEEADPAEIADIVVSGATTFACLANIARRSLDRSNPNRIHLDQLASRTTGQSDVLADVAG